MSRIKRAKPSPALIVAVVALVAALVGTAVGGVAVTSLSKNDKKAVTRIAKKQGKRQANKQISKKEPGLNVKSATTAQNADLLDGQDGSDFTPRSEVQTPARMPLADPQPGDSSAAEGQLLTAGPFVFTAECAEDFNGSGQTLGSVGVQGPDGYSVSAPGGLSNPDAPGIAPLGIGLSDSANVVQAFPFVAVAPEGSVVTGTASVEVNDPIGHCVFGLTVIGP